MKYLTIDLIVYLNHRTVEENGGLFVPPSNFLHGEQLEYVVDAVQGEMFGQEVYPTLADKAAVYMFNIISNHVFADGNKRTGLTAALHFLAKNGHFLRDTLVEVNGRPYQVSHDKALENFTLAVASARVTLDECRAWFTANIVPVTP